jgi:diguanylate cyclase (GGDEF)-like protein
MPNLPGSRILIGTGDPGESSYLQHVLESWGHRVQVMRDGHKVLQRLHEPAPPEVLLLDANLPGMGGIEVVQEYRQRTRKPAAWIMVMCESPSPEQVMLATDAGTDDFLAKPIDEFDLRIRLHTAARVRELRIRLAQSQEDVRFHASHDHLTGLWNREALLRLLFQETDRVQRMHTPLALILLDLDHFSVLNLRYGNTAGDQVLRQIADRFRRYLRSYDLIGRCGEDEFLLALPGCGLDLAGEQAERLRLTVRQRPFTFQDAILNVTASFGVAESRGRSPLIVLREAERALADAKLGGRDRVAVFQTTMAALPAHSATPEARQMRLDSAAESPLPTARLVAVRAEPPRNVLSDGSSTRLSRCCRRGYEGEQGLSPDCPEPRS